MIVLGIDPGANTGRAWLDCSDLAHPRLLGMDTHRADDPCFGTFLAQSFWPHRPSLIALESVAAVYSRDRFGAGMASALVVAARIEGRILEMARAASIPVLQCTAGEWRKVIAGSRTATDARIKAALSLRMTLPRTNAHVRDAVGVALYAAQKRRVEGMVA